MGDNGEQYSRAFDLLIFSNYTVDIHWSYIRWNIAARFKLYKLSKMKNSRNSKSSMPNIEACFAQLGLQPTASVSEVKDSYRQLAKLTHPGKCKEPDATERFKALNSAYATLISWFSAAINMTNTHKSKTPARSQESAECIKVTEHSQCVVVQVGK